MKIAYIATSGIPSTTANSIQVMKVCQALTQNGETVELLIPGRRSVKWDTLAQHYGLSVKFPIRWIPSWKPLKRFDFVIRSLYRARQDKVDLVYTRMLWVAVGAQRLRLPVILELHELPAGRFGPWLFQKYVRPRGKKCTVFITKALRCIVESSYQINLPDDEVIIAPDGVDMERYQNLPNPSAARQKLGLKDIPTAAYSGGFYAGRGLEILFELGKAFPEVQFLWIGGSPDVVAKWRKTISKNGIGNVILTGFVENEKLPLYQAAADVLLMPYGKSIAGSSGGNIAEVSSPMKMFEYMAAGKVILTSDIPVLREVLNEHNAMFYAPEDFADLKMKFASLLSDAKKRDDLANQAREDVKKYTWQVRMSMILKSFGEIS